MSEYTDKDWLVLSIGTVWPSKHTAGKCRTYIFRNMQTNESYKGWSDTTCDSHPWWEKLTVGDVVTDIAPYNEAKKILSSSHRPRVIGHVDNLSK